MRYRIATGLAAAVLILLSLVLLERDRAGLQITALSVGTTPVTLYQRPGEAGPVVVVAHGFAGSRQIMQAYSLPLAQAGYRVLAFDFEGHGRNPVPMSGDVTSIDGTTALLVAETRRVIAAARALADGEPLALLGHSMATDIIVRASIAEAAAGRPVEAVVGISMFSQAVTAQEPARLLILSGEWEAALRAAALDAVRLVDREAGEGDLAVSGPVTRLALAAPSVEHVGVLFSPTAVDAARDWLDRTFQRPGGAGAGQRGLWILTLLGGIVLLAVPLVALLPRGEAAAKVPPGRFWLAVLAPALAVPLLVVPLYQSFLPVLVADYLMLHLALFGLLQLALLPRPLLTPLPRVLGSAVALAFWGIAVFGLALDRYAANFWPTPERLPIIAALALGTIPLMLADNAVAEGGRAPLWRRVVARLLLFTSLGLAALLDPESLMFVLIVLPLFALFYLVHGALGRLVARQSGGAAAALGLGLCLAWVLGVSFPLFAQP